MAWAERRRAGRPRDPRTETLLAHYQTLPPERAGGIMLLLWLNAVVTLALNAVWATTLVLALVRVRRAWSHQGASAGITALPTRGLTAATAASCAHLLATRVVTLLLVSSARRASARDET